MSKIIESDRVKRDMAGMQKGGIIIDVVNAEQVRVAEEAGAVTVMTLERVPSDIRAASDVARVVNLGIVEEVMNAVSIPVMAKACIGHIAKAKILEAMGVDYIDKSEVLTPADEEYRLREDQFIVPFICGCRNLSEATCRIGGGVAMLRTKGGPGTGNIVETVRHMRQVNSEVSRLAVVNDDEIMTFAKDIGAPCEILKQIKDNGHLPVVNSAAGGVTTPQGAALMMELGTDGVFVGSGIFKSEDPEKLTKAIVQATAHYQDYELIGRLASEPGTVIKGLGIDRLSLEERIQGRDW